ncbi:hypothetical protein [Modestobacter excelsi]|uniref:hypothetical protein n=1 Tax=Modestobacter excelsi TaxID=2213161 RepID=UPI00110D0A5F|nr:hypothetical protein [Modestobacter excelsi]
MAEEQPDRFVVVVVTCLRAFKWLIAGGTTVGSILALQPLVHEIAGESTTFDFTAGLNVSIGINVVVGGAVIHLVRQNRALRRQVRQLERDRPPAAPGAKALPLPGDTGEDGSMRASR